MDAIAPGTIVVYSDIGCPWAHLAVYRVHAARQQLGLQHAVVLDHRAFPLEVLNDRPTPWNTLSAEVAAECDVDASALRVALDEGRSRRSLFDQYRTVSETGVQGSPHLFLPEGSDAHDPGVKMD